jgi:hypothetical protein
MFSRTSEGRASNEFAIFERDGLTTWIEAVFLTTYHESVYSEIHGGILT